LIINDGESRVPFSKHGRFKIAKRIPNFVIDPNFLANQTGYTSEIKAKIQGALIRKTIKFMLCEYNIISEDEEGWGYLMAFFPCREERATPQEFKNVISHLIICY
jgi:hypothetical protein